jgi:hypothetical protein
VDQKNEAKRQTNRRGNSIVPRVPVGNSDHQHGHDEQHRPLLSQHPEVQILPPQHACLPFVQTDWEKK